MTLSQFVLAVGLAFIFIVCGLMDARAARRSARIRRVVAPWEVK